MEFEWDLRKAIKNARDHGVSFEEARECFRDFRGIELIDEDHSDRETRFIRIGLSGTHLLYVVYTMNGERYRIIHARKADKQMEKLYEAG
jgi:uncharacterized DUF497 family protein